MKITNEEICMCSYSFVSMYDTSCAETTPKVCMNLENKQSNIQSLT